MTKASAPAQKRWLITGASGYVAAAIVAALGGHAQLIRRVSRSALIPIATSAAQGTRIEDLSGDYFDRDFLRAAVDGVDVVIHLASGTSAYQAEADPMASLMNTVGLTQQIIEACAGMSTPPTLVLAGTATQFGLTKSVPVGDDHADAPVTYYDLHKLMAEQAVTLAAARGRVPGCTLRLSNVYGPGPASSVADRGILNKMVANALKGQDVTMYGDGEHLRDYVFIDDVARAFVLAASPEAAKGGHYVIGTGKGHTLKDAFALVVERVRAKTGQAVGVRSVPWPDGVLPIEFRNFVSDSSAFENATGWTAEVDLIEGIDRTIDSFRGQPK